MTYVTCVLPLLRGDCSCRYQTCDWDPQRVTWDEVWDRQLCKIKDCNISWLQMWQEAARGNLAHNRLARWLDHKKGRGPKRWCFWTVVLEKTLQSSLDCKEIQSVHPKGDPPWTFQIDSLEGLMLKLNLQYFGHLIRRASSLEKTLMLGNIEGKRRRGQQRMRWLDSMVK